MVEVSEKLKRRAVGVRLKNLMDEQGISTSQLASALGVTAGAVSQWRCGNSRMSDANLEQVASILHTTATYLTTGYGDDGGEQLYPLSSLEQAVVSAIRENAPQDGYTSDEKQLIQHARACKSLSVTQLVEIVDWLSNASVTDLLDALNAFQMAANKQSALLMLEDN